MERGYRGLTMRAVASECGITSGNLHYHFPTTDALVTELVQSVLEAYKLEFTRQLSDLRPGSIKAFVDLAGWLVADASKPEVNILFREFVAMVSHYPEMAAAMAALYTEVIDDFVEALRVAFPRVPHRRLLQVGRLMVVLSEGSGVVGASDRTPMQVPTNELVRMARNAVRLALREATGPPQENPG